MKTLKDLLGRTILSVSNTDTEIVFYLDCGTSITMHHYQDCCESVYVEDIEGDLEDLVGGFIIQFDESTSNTLDEAQKLKDLLLGKVTPFYEDSQTWTFYRIATNKGSVVIRWFGESNGYYSEKVSITARNPSWKDSKSYVDLND